MCDCDARTVTLHYTRRITPKRVVETDRYNFFESTDIFKKL